MIGALHRYITRDGACEQRVIYALTAPAAVIETERTLRETAELLRRSARGLPVNLRRRKLSEADGMINACSEIDAWHSDTGCAACGTVTGLDSGLLYGNEVME